MLARHWTVGGLAGLALIGQALGAPISLSAAPAYSATSDPDTNISVSIPTDFNGDGSPERFFLAFGCDDRDETFGRAEPVTEPSSLVLMGAAALGLLVLVWRRRRRRRKRLQRIYSAASA